jgi:hypothetical protein
VVPRHGGGVLGGTESGGGLCSTTLDAVQVSVVIYQLCHFGLIS